MNVTNALHNPHTPSKNTTGFGCGLRSILPSNEGRTESRATDHTQQQDQHDRSDKGGDDRSDQSPGMDAEGSEEPAAEEGADHADDHVSDDSEAAAAHDSSGEPARDQ